MDTNNLSNILSGVMSNPEMMSKLQGILSDPAAMNSIKNAVSGISGTLEPQRDEGTAMPVHADNDEAKNRARLISALKPYLSEERREKADKLLSLLTLLSVSGNIKL